MSKFDHVQPPKHFARHHKTLIVTTRYQFTSDNRIYFSNTEHVDLENHTYTLEVELWSKTDEHGMAVDFKDIDKVYREHLEPLLDGQLINDTLPDMNTTVENIHIGYGYALMSIYQKACHSTPFRYMKHLSKALN